VDEISWFTAGFVGSPHDAQDLGTPYPRLAIGIPRFVAIRRGTGNPLRSAPHSVCVIGGHWAGSADVASFLGYAFDHDYSHVGFVASRAFSRLTHQWYHDLFDRDRLEVARTYTVSAEIGRSRVWAAGGDGVTATCRLIADHRLRMPLVVYLRAGDDLIEWTARARNLWQMTDVPLDEDIRAMRDERQAVIGLLSGIRYRALVVDVNLPDDASFREPGTAGQADAFFDMWANLAESVIFRMRSELQTRFEVNDALDRLRSGGRNLI
jgi:hypothetical protein